jgi:hypothetical protein
MQSTEKIYQLTLNEVQMTFLKRNLIKIIQSCKEPIIEYDTFLGLHNSVTKICIYRDELQAIFELASMVEIDFTNDQRKDNIYDIPTSI